MNGQTVFSPVEQVDEIQTIEDVSNALSNLGLHDSAECIRLINKYEPEDLGGGAPLTFTSAMSFYNFLKNKFFTIEPKMGLSDNGEIKAYWNLSNDESVWIYFLNNNDLDYFIDSSTTSVKDVARLSNIFHILSESKVTRC